MSCCDVMLNPVMLLRLTSSLTYLVALGSVRTVIDFCQIVVRLWMSDISLDSVVCILRVGQPSVLVMLLMWHEPFTSNSLLSLFSMRLRPGLSSPPRWSHWRRCTWNAYDRYSTSCHRCGYSVDNWLSPRTKHSSARWWCLCLTLLDVEYTVHIISHPYCSWLWKHWPQCLRNRWLDQLYNDCSFSYKKNGGTFVMVVVLKWRYSPRWLHRINDDDDDDNSDTICCVCRCWRLVVSSASKAVKRGLNQWKLRHHHHSHSTTIAMLRTISRCLAMRLHCLMLSRLHWTVTTRPLVALDTFIYTSVVCLYVCVTLWSTVDRLIFWLTNLSVV